jgi:methionyl-tRNA formyltransferase
MKNRVVFFGSSDFSIPILISLIREYSVVTVITKPDKQKGRGKKLQISPVKEAALTHDIAVYQPARLSADTLLPILEKLKADVFVVAAYGKILPAWLLELPKFGCINVHASLLPRYRGASPIQAVILAGEKKTGVTIMLMDEGLDTGHILAQKEISVSSDETYGSLSAKLSKLGADFMLETLTKFICGKITPIPQENQDATYCGLIHKNDGRLDFNLTAEELERSIRAYQPWPGSEFEWVGKTLKVHSVEITDSKNLAPLERGILDNFPAVGTASWDLLLRKVQVPGKKIISGSDFLNGARDWLEN